LRQKGFFFKKENLLLVSMESFRVVYKQMAKASPKGDMRERGSVVSVEGGAAAAFTSSMETWERAHRRGLNAITALGAANPRARKYANTHTANKYARVDLMLRSLCTYAKEEKDTKEHLIHTYPGAGMGRYAGAEQRWKDREESAKAIGFNVAGADWSCRVSEEQVQGVDEVSV